MSLTVSRGMMDAARWTTVAMAVSEYLEAVEEALDNDRELPPSPAGALDAAEQFFSYVQTALDQGSNRAQGTAQSKGLNPAPLPMAGISSLSIAVTVIRSSQGEASVNLQMVREQIDTFTAALSALKKDEIADSGKEGLHRLLEFFKALGKAGRIERAATIAFHEQPTRSFS